MRKPVQYDSTSLKNVIRHFQIMAIRKLGDRDEGEWPWGLDPADVTVIRFPAAHLGYSNGEDRDANKKSQCGSIGHLGVGIGLPP